MKEEGSEYKSVKRMERHTVQMWHGKIECRKSKEERSIGELMRNGS